MQPTPTRTPPAPRFTDMPGRLLHAQRLHRPWRALLTALIVVVAWLSFVPASGQQSFDHSDKLAHAAAFLALGFTAALSWPPSRQTTWRAALALMAYGAFIEGVQGLLPSRTADGLDLLADGVGMAVGLWAVQAMRSRWPPRLA